MCHYYSKPFDGDLIDKVIYTDNSITITDIAPCGYHNLVMPYTTVTNIGSFTYPEIYPDLDFVILTDLYDSGGFNSSYTGYVYFKDIINRNLSSVYTENFQIVASQNEPRQGISSKQTYYDEFGNLVIYYTIVGVVMESPPIYDIVYSSGLTNHYYVYDPVEYLIDWYDKYLLGSPRLSGVLDNNTWGMVYFDGLSWSYTTEDYFQLSNSSYKIKIVLCGKEFSSLYTFDVSIAGSTIDEYEIIIPQSPMSSNLRIYSVNGDIYLLSCLKDVSHVDSYYSGAITTTNPKCRYIIARYNDETSTSHTVEFDEIFDDDDSLS